MKKISIKLISLITILTVLFSVFSVLPVLADSATISVSNPNPQVGSNVTVTVRCNSNMKLFNVNGSLSYNSSVLQYVSGGAGQNGSSVKLYADLSGESSTSFTVTFKAVAAGSSGLGVNLEASDGTSMTTPSASASVNVTTPVPSSDCNLSALRLSQGVLSPAFSPKIVKYNVTVKYGVTKVTVYGSLASPTARCAGGGTFGLAVGENTRDITVTAADGTKKTYTIIVKRLSEAETAEAEKLERENDPTLITIDDKDAHIATDLSSVTIPSNFAQSAATFRNAQVPVITDSKGKYTFYYISLDDGSKSGWYVNKKDDTFVPAKQITVGSVMYVITTPKTEKNIPNYWKHYEYELSEGNLADAYTCSDKRLKDFYVFYCYESGNTDFYRYDAKSGTIQRYPDFTYTSDEMSAQTGPATFIGKLKALTLQGKIVLGLLVFGIICVIACIVLLIINLAKKKMGENAVDPNATYISFGGEEEDGATPYIETAAEFIGKAFEQESENK